MIWPFKKRVAPVEIMQSRMPDGVPPEIREAFELMISDPSGWKKDLYNLKHKKSGWSVWFENVPYADQNVGRYGLNLYNPSRELADLVRPITLELLGIIYQRGK